MEITRTQATGAVASTSEATEVDGTAAVADTTAALDTGASSFEAAQASAVALSGDSSGPLITDGPLFKVAVCMGPTTTGGLTPIGGTGAARAMQGGTELAGPDDVHTSREVGSKDPSRTDGYSFTEYDGKGWSRTAVDPNSPYQGMEGPIGHRTGAKFVEVPPYDGTPSTTSPFVTGEGLADKKVDPQYLSDHLLPDGLGGRVLDQHDMGTPKEVYDSLRAAKTPEEYAALLDKYGGTITGGTLTVKGNDGQPVTSVSMTQHIFGVTHDDPGHVGLRRDFALGPYEQVATYMNQNPDVAKAAQAFAEKTGINAHVYAEWEFLHAGGGRDQGHEWPKEVMYLPNTNQLQMSAGTPYAERAAQTYLKNNPDVAALATKYPKMSPQQFALYHYDQVGRFEGRSMGEMHYQGRQGTEAFERYYFGDMTSAESDHYWNGGATDEGTTASAASGANSRSPKNAGADAPSGPRGADSVTGAGSTGGQIEAFAKRLGLSALTLKLLKQLSPEQQRVLLQLFEAKLDDGPAASVKREFNEALNALLKSAKPTNSALERV